VRARILVVDTETVVRALARQFSTACPDWELVSAHSADQALERCSATAFDLMLVDEFLPDRGGMDLVMDIRSFDPWVGITLLRSGGSAHETVEMLRLGVDHYLEKPLYDFAAVVRELSSLIDESRRRRGASQQGFVPTRSLPPPIAAGASARASALVVSPLRSEREWVGRQLHDRASVRELATSSAALAIIELAPVDLMIVDADVREPDAFDLIAAVNELIVGIRCVVVAGSFTPSEVKRYTELGVTALIKKPFEAIDFSARLARVLRVGRGSSLPAPPSMRSSA
jgi:DNA-binding response OmpR family regulator